jgi:hypothetical protein
MFEDILNHGGKFENVEISKKLAIPNLIDLILKPNILNNRNNIILVNNEDHLSLIQILIQQNTHQLFLILNFDQKIINEFFVFAETFEDIAFGLDFLGEGVVEDLVDETEDFEGVAECEEDVFLGLHGKEINEDFGNQGEGVLVLPLRNFGNQE